MTFRIKRDQRKTVGLSVGQLVALLTVSSLCLADVAASIPIEIRVLDSSACVEVHRPVGEKGRARSEVAASYVISPVIDLDPPLEPGSLEARLLMSEDERCPGGMANLAFYREGSSDFGTRRAIMAVSICADRVDQNRMVIEGSLCFRSGRPEPGVCKDDKGLRLFIYSPKLVDLAAESGKGEVGHGSDICDFGRSRPIASEKPPREVGEAGYRHVRPLSITTSEDVAGDPPTEAAAPNVSPSEVDPAN